MGRTIHLNDSFFGRNAGTIDDDGTIRLPDGIWGSQTVGYLEKDGVYVPDGWGRRKVIDISSLGHMFLMEDAGLFSRGTWVGSISPDGEVRDTDRRAVAELRKGLGDGSDTVTEIFGSSEGEGKDDETDDEPGPGTITEPKPIIPLALITFGGVVLALAAMWTIVSHTPALLTSESISAGGQVGVAVTLLFTAVTTVFVSLKSEQGVLSTLVDCLGAGTVVAILTFGAYTLIADPPAGLGDWLLFLLFMPFVCFCWAAATSALVALPICGARAAMRE